MENITFELVEEIFTVSRLMKNEMSFSNELMRLSALQFHALLYINKHKTVTMSDIARYFRIELPSATSLIKTLVKSDLVTRKEDEHDRRLVVITLSSEGETLVNRLLELRRKSLETKLAYLSTKDQVNLLKI